MTLGLTPGQGDLLRTTASFCEDRVTKDSIYAVLHRECFNLFPDAMFADLFTHVCRRSVPPMIVAVVMVLQRIKGCPYREAADRFTFDTRWKYADGGLSFDYPGFVHPVLVDMRTRLAASASPDRFFEVTLQAAKSAGLVGRKRVLDSTPLYDAVAHHGHRDAAALGHPGPGEGRRPGSGGPARRGAHPRRLLRGRREAGPRVG